MPRIPFRGSPRKYSWTVRSLSAKLLDVLDEQLGCGGRAGVEQRGQAGMERPNLGERFLAELEQVYVVVHLADLPADGGVAAAGCESVFLKERLSFRLPLRVGPVDEPCCHPYRHQAAHSVLKSVARRVDEAVSEASVIQLRNAAATRALRWSSPVREQ